MIDIDI